MILVGDHLKVITHHLRPYQVAKNKCIFKSMSQEKTKFKHVFYHADRSASLKEEQKIELGEDGLSNFGRVYSLILEATPGVQMNPEHQREFYLEHVRRELRYASYASRLQSIFAANTIAEAIIFANSIFPIPTHRIPIIEILAERFWTLDSNWLDYENEAKRVDYYRNYWEAIISNHRPDIGERRPPRLEVIIALPAFTGKIVHVVE
jgi:hypothetical protein